MNAERLLLSALSRATKREIDEVLSSGLSLKSFQQHAQEAAWAWAHMEKHGKFPDAVTLNRRFSDLVVKRTPEPLQHYVDALGERHLGNVLSRLTQQAARKLQSGVSAYDVLEFYRSGLDSVGDDRTLTQDVSWTTSGKDRLRAYSNRKKVIATEYIPTPWPSLNRLILGFRRSQLITLAARYAVGKTFLAVCIALHAAMQKKKVLIFSLEMTREEMTDRMDALGAKVDWEKYLAGNLDPAQRADLEKFVLSLEKTGGEVIITEDITLRGLTPEFAASKIQKYDPDLVIVDGAYLMAQNDENLVQGMVKLSRTMKRLAKSRKLPVIQVHQIGRKGEGKQQGGGHGSIAWSDAVEQDSDLLLELVGDRSQNCRLIRVLKGRQHPMGDVWINFKFSPRIDMSEIAAMNQPISVTPPKKIKLFGANK